MGSPLAWQPGAIALVGFGIDAAIEVFAALVVSGQLRGGAHARMKTALRLIAISFFVLAGRGARVHPRPGRPGQGWRIDRGHGARCRCVAAMIRIAIAPRRTGRELDNQAFVAQSGETWVSNYLSISLLVGLGLNAAFGLWWADPVAALVVAAIAVKNGCEAWKESRWKEDSG